VKAKTTLPLSSDAVSSSLESIDVIEQVGRAVKGTDSESKYPNAVKHADEKDRKRFAQRASELGLAM
jgi:hypothetical protein